MFPNMFLNEDDLVKTIEEILDGLASVNSTSEKRIELLSRLERCFGLAVLKEEGIGEDARKQQGIETDSSLQNRQQSQWWKAQSKPRTCIALALISLIHRLHLQGQQSTSSKSTIDHESEMTACFTILQGLCLKDLISRQICSSKSTLELIIAIIDAQYWNQIEQDRIQALAHAIDLLICVTMASRSASALFDSLGGEEIIRKLMNSHCTKSDCDESDGTKSARGTISLDDLQTSPIAVKCTEFLLLFASERNDAGNETLDLLADQTSIFVPYGAGSSFIGERSRILETNRKQSIDKSKREIENRKVKTNQVEEDILQRSRRARSASPIKSQQQNRRMLRSPVISRKSGAFLDRNNDKIQEEGELPRIRRSVPVGRILSAAYIPTKSEPSSSSGSPTKSFPPPTIQSNSQFRIPSHTPHSTPFIQNSNKFRTPSLVIDSGLCDSPNNIESSSTSLSSSPNRDRHHHRGRNNERDALIKIRTPNHTNQSSKAQENTKQKKSITSSFESSSDIKESNDLILIQPSSPLKALMGPSPAVRRAYARSVSPEKKR